MGGPCFLKAFSHFFRMRSNDQYYVPRDEQLQRRHPVTWLRTKMLVDRARKYGLHTLADGVQNVWPRRPSRGVQEDYEGTWSEDFFLPLRQMLDDMIRGICSQSHQSADVIVPAGHAKSLSPVQLCNIAWNQFEAEGKSYRAWEKDAIDLFALRLIRNCPGRDLRCRTRFPRDRQTAISRASTFPELLSQQIPSRYSTPRTEEGPPPRQTGRF